MANLTPVYHDGGGNPVYNTPPIELGEPGYTFRYVCPNCDSKNDLLIVRLPGGDTGPDIEYICEDCDYRYVE